MASDPSLILSVSDFLAVLNQTLEYSYPSVEIEAEVSSFKVNQGKYVFFDLKDAGGSVGCFMTVWQLRVPVEDGMKVIVKAIPKVTPWGKFSLTVQAIRPSGEGSLKKSFEILLAKLTKEGLFSEERKRSLPVLPHRIGVISSTQAAGYADFIKIMNDRWGGMQIDVAHVQVQGASAPDQMIRAIKYFNEQEVLPELLVVIRGGGSADDLAAFNDELLVREIAASRIPIITGIGHEIDLTLSDLAADVRAATPSNVAQLIVPDRREIIQQARQSLRRILLRSEQAINDEQLMVQQRIARVIDEISARVDDIDRRLVADRHLIAAYDPRAVLERGYALVRGDVRIGATITIERKKDLITAEVKDVKAT